MSRTHRCELARSSTSRTTGRGAMSPRSTNIYSCAYASSRKMQRRKRHVLVEISSKQGNDGNDQYSIDVVHELEHSLNLDAMRGCGGEILSLKPSSSL